MAPVVFFDLDGVLADFVRGAFRLHGREVPVRSVRWDFWTQLGFQPGNDPAFWGPMDRGYWRELPAYGDGFILLAAVERMVPRDRIALATSAQGSDGCIDGKRDWVKHNLPEYLPRLFTGAAKELFAAPGKLLIDDSDMNVTKFRAAGGETVLVPRPWNCRGWACIGDGQFDPLAVAEDVRHALMHMNRNAA